MSSITVTLPDGSQREAAPGTPVREFAAQALPPSLLKRALAATVNGRMVDLTCPLERDAAVTLVLPDGPEALALYSH